MMLSKHFSLEELTASEVAARAGIDNTPPAEAIRNLVRLAEGLELVRAAPSRRQVFPRTKSSTSSADGATSASRPKDTPPETNCSPSQMPPPATSWVCAVYSAQDTVPISSFPD